MLYLLLQLLQVCGSQVHHPNHYIVAVYKLPQKKKQFLSAAILQPPCEFVG